MSNENNVVNLNRIKNLTRDDVIDHLERCQMAAEVTLPVANMEALLTQLLGYMDNSKPEPQQKLTESERYGRQADIKIENLERKVEQLAAENAALKDGAIKAIEDIQCFYDSEAWHVSEDGESETAVVALDDAKGSVEHFVINVETPATSAFLAEVRASGVEMFAASLKVVGPHEHPYSVVANEFASQLRQGGSV